MMDRFPGTSCPLEERFALVHNGGPTNNDVRRDTKEGSMNKLMAMLLALSFLSTSCNKSGGSSEESAKVTAPAVADDADPTPPEEPKVPALALSFGTNVELMNFTDAQADKYNQAIAIVKKVVATEKFKDSVLNYTYAGETQFADNGGKTNAQIYQSVLDAAEKLTPAKNNTMDLGVKLYYQDSSTVGWTSTGITYINVNTKFFNTYAANSVAGNLFHEWLHKLGYGHDVSATAKRPYSVPYAIGYLIRTIGANFL